MSLMFAKQFSEAGATSGGPSKKGGRGNKGGGLMSKSKRRGKDLEDAGDSSTGLFNMDPNTPYRTHMLFPGRKEDDSGGPDPRRSSGSPGFVKAMMGWGSKRASQGAAGAGGQEMALRRGTPTRPPEGTEPLLDPIDENLYRKSVSFHGCGDPYYPNTYHQPASTNGGAYHHHTTSPTSSYNHTISPTSPYNHTNSPTTNHHLLGPSSPTNHHQLAPNNYHNHHEPYREHDYAAFAVGMLIILLTFAHNPSNISLLSH